MLVSGKQTLQSFSHGGRIQMWIQMETFWTLVCDMFLGWRINPPAGGSEREHVSACVLLWTYQLTWVWHLIQEVKTKPSACLVKNNITLVQLRCQCGLFREAAGKLCLFVSGEMTFSHRDFRVEIRLYSTIVSETVPVLSNVITKFNIPTAYCVRVVGRGALLILAYGEFLRFRGNRTLI